MHHIKGFLIALLLIGSSLQFAFAGALVISISQLGKQKNITIFYPDSIQCHLESGTSIVCVGDSLSPKKQNIIYNKDERETVCRTSSGNSAPMTDDPHNVGHACDCYLPHVHSTILYLKDKKLFFDKSAEITAFLRQKDTCVHLTDR